MARNLTPGIISQAQAGDMKAREAVCKRMEPILVSLAKRFTEGSTVPMEDMIQEGYVAVLESLASFSPLMGVSFETYCYGPIRRGMADAAPSYLSGPSIPARTMSRYWDVMKAAEGDVAKAVEIAPAMDMKRETFAMVHEVVTGTWSINHGPEGTVDGHEDREISLYSDSPNDLAAPDPFEEVASLMEAEAYLAVLTDPREVGVLKMLMGFDGREPMSQAEVGKAIGVSQQMVTKIYARALGNIRKALAEGK